MAKYGKKSRAALNSCHHDLQEVFNEVIKHVDCSILEGHRDKETQNRYYDEGKSKIRYPDGKHNKTPSLAVDAVPYPIDWKDIERMRMFAGYVLGVANTLGIKLRLGADWDGDWNIKEQSFVDIPHFELVNDR